MNVVIAKVKNQYKRVLSQKETIIEDWRKTIERINYTNSHKLDEDEWFQVENFSNSGFSIELCSEDFSTASLNQIKNDDYNDVSCLYVMNAEQIHFQKISSALFVQKRTMLDFSEEPKIVKPRRQIEVRDESDAVYDKESDILIFKNISKIKTMFPGIEELQREATQPEVDSFLGNKFISLTNQYSAMRVGSLNRKRIADIGNKYNNLSPQKKHKLLDYAKEKSGLKSKNGVFLINSEADLKNLLYAMDQRYYYADIYSENRLANSVRIV